MNYIIDGHNLIGKVADIDLSDPDDEAKLVLRLISWSAVGENRRVVVVFDGGVYGTNWSAFRSDRVKVVFVPQGKSADDWIIHFLQKQIGNDVKSFHLVSSDQRILKQAENRRVPFTKSEQFAGEIAAERKTWSQLGQEERIPPQHERPLLREHEVDAWLAMFGGEPTLTIKPYQPPIEPPKPASIPLTPKTAQAKKEMSDAILSPDEVKEWLSLFGGEPNMQKTNIPAASQTKTGAKKEKPRTIKPRRGPTVSDRSPLEQDDVDLWHSLFGKD